MGFTFSKRLFISLHFAKKKTHMKIDQVGAELHLAKRCGDQKLHKINFLILLDLEAELP